MSALPNYKDIVDLLKKGATLEAQEKILELREAALGLQEDNLQLRSQLAQLQDQLKTAKSIRFEHGLYWMDKDDGMKDGPFCPTCRDKDAKLIRLRDGRDLSSKDRWFCHVCKFWSNSAQ